MTMFAFSFLRHDFDMVLDIEDFSLSVLHFPAECSVADM